MLPKLLTLLEALDLVSTSEEIADILWLAAKLNAPPRPTPAPEPSPAPPSTPPPVVDAQPASIRSTLPMQRPMRTTENIVSPASLQAQPSQADLYPIQTTQTPDATSDRRGQSFRSPAAFALPGALELGRALRPLNRRVPSRTRKVLDEQATAQHIAATGDWIPLLNPAPERWLDVALVVDESPSMVIWQRTIAELQILLERQGAFRSVQTWGFQADRTANTVQLYAGFGPTADRQRLRRPAELIDQQGQRLLLVISDCVARIWRSGALNNWLTLWGKAGLVTLIQVLPQRLWPRTALRNYPALALRSRLPGTPNHQLEREWVSPRLRQRPIVGIPIPIVTLEANSLTLWARSLAGNNGLWIPGLLCEPNSSSASAPMEEMRANTRPSAQPLIEQFTGMASPTARQLAGHLAAVPLTLPIMRLVQRVMLPDSRQVHLAEVFLSGLFERQTPASANVPPDQVEYEFLPGVRDLLRNSLPLDEAIDVLTEVSAFIGQHSGQPLDFTALIDDPMATNAQAVPIPAEYRAFAHIAAPALRRFGGRYAQLAARLATSTGGAEQPTVTLHQDDSASASSTEDGTETEQSDRVATLFALLVGIDEYDPRSRIPTLRGCVSDVQITKTQLIEHLELPEDNITLLANEQATRHNFINYWQTLAKQVKAGDQVFFMYCGQGSQTQSSDPNEGDGLDETLVLYDSRTEGSSDIRHPELAELLTPIEKQGAQIVIYLDTVYGGGGFFSRQATDNRLVLASCHENEKTYEQIIHEDEQQRYTSVATYAFHKALQNYYPDLNWAQVYDQLFVNVKAKSTNQTPQLIGPGGLRLFSNERASVSPYLLVIQVETEQRIVRVNAHAALGLELGARLAIYPPGSDMIGTPLAQATVTGINTTDVVATLDETQITLQPASRVQITSYSREPHGLRVGWDLPTDAPSHFSPLVQVVAAAEAQVDYRVVMESNRYSIEDRAGRQVVGESLPPNDSITSTVDKISGVLDRIARYRRVLERTNPNPSVELADKVMLTVENSSQATPANIVAEQPITLVLRNLAEQSLYISVWMLNERFGVERIYPPRTDCLLIAASREIRIPVVIPALNRSNQQEKVIFKVFATREPAALDVLQLPDLPNASGPTRSSKDNL